MKVWVVVIDDHGADIVKAFSSKGKGYDFIRRYLKDNADLEAGLYRSIEDVDGDYFLPMDVEILTDWIQRQGMDISWSISELTVDGAEIQPPHGVVML